MTGRLWKTSLGSDFAGLGGERGRWRGSAVAWCWAMGLRVRVRVTRWGTTELQVGFVYSIERSRWATLDAGSRVEPLSPIVPSGGSPSGSSVTSIQSSHRLCQASRRLEFGTRTAEDTGSLFCGTVVSTVSPREGAFGSLGAPASYRLNAGDQAGAGRP